MKWFKKKIHSWVKEIDQSEPRQDISGAIGLSIHDKSPDIDPVLTFKIYGAANGKIIEFSSYDSKTDRFNRNNYIVNDSDDLETVVNRCLVQELLMHGK